MKKILELFLFKLYTSNCAICLQSAIHFINQLKVNSQNAPASSLANMHAAPYAVYFILLELSELISMHRKGSYVKFPQSYICTI